MLHYGRAFDEFGIADGCMAGYEIEGFAFAVAAWAAFYGSQVNFTSLHKKGGERGGKHIRRFTFLDDEEGANDNPPSHAAV